MAAAQRWGLLNLSDARVNIDLFEDIIRKVRNAARIPRRHS